MTSKEIANKWQMNRYLTPHIMGGMNNKEFYEQLDDDISNYAKQQCKLFASFIISNFWQDLSNDESDEWVSDAFTDEMKTYTFEEVYTLYLNQP